MGLPLDSILINRAIKIKNGANKTVKINENMISSSLLKNNDSPPAVMIVIILKILNNLIILYNRRAFKQSTKILIYRCFK